MKNALAPFDGASRETHGAVCHHVATTASASGRSLLEIGRNFGITVCGTPLPSKNEAPSLYVLGNRRCLMSVLTVLRNPGGGGGVENTCTSCPRDISSRACATITRVPPD